MRFGRRPRSRGHVHAANISEYPRASVGTVASDERNALLGTPSIRLLEPAPQRAADASDATQLLLTSLGRFQRELNGASDESQRGYWSGECMNQLIDCVEVALANGWSELVEALTDTGRILQSYENAGRPEDGLDFLNDAYELLCLMVGDLIVESIRPGVMKQWRERYEEALSHLEQEGIALVADEEADPEPVSDVPQRDGSGSPSTDIHGEVPFEMPDETVVDTTLDELLPTLDELPPLEAILEAAQRPKVPSTETCSEAPEPTVTEKPRKSAPSRLVIEILDQLCEQLAIVESGPADKTNYAVDRFTGGVRAIEREAREQTHEIAVELCEMMLGATRAAKTGSGTFREGFTELAYAFCGAYMDAFQEDDLDTVSSWRVECKGLVARWGRQEPAEPEPEESAPALAETTDRESANAAVTGLAETTPGVEAESEPGESEPLAGPVGPELEAPATGVAGDVVDETTSAGLLEAAQLAARRGNAAEAKRFALQAAGAIARDEVKAAEQSLQLTKERLKAGLEAAREARDYVRETETAVQEIAADVSAGETALGKAREEAAAVAQQLEDIRSSVAELERQIAELQERREQELEKAAQTGTELGAATARVKETEEELAERRAAEAAARTDLETRRQTVNELQRTAHEIEAEVDGVNALLDEKQKSFNDISDAIRQICGDSGTPHKDEGLLF